MSSAPALPTPEDCAPEREGRREAQRNEDAQYYRQVLHKFIDMATDLAEAAHRRAMAEGVERVVERGDGAESAEPAPQPAGQRAPDPAITLDRLARTVRRTIALARTLSEPDRVPRAAQSARESGHERAQQSPEQQSPEQRRAERRLAARQRALAAKPLAKLTDAELHELRAAQGLACDSEGCSERYNELDRKEDLSDGCDDDEDDGELDDALIAYACRSLGITDLPDTHPWKRVLDQVTQAGAPDEPGHARDPRAYAAQRPCASAPLPESGVVSRQAPAQPPPLRPHAPPQSTQRGIRPGTDPPH